MVFNKNSILCIAILMLVFTAVSGGEAVSGGASGATAVVEPTPSPEAPQFNSYRGVSIGMSADQARTKLGTPKERSAGGEYYVFSDSESAQLTFDADKTVRSITVNFTGDLKSAPTPKDVVGVDIKKESDGSISKMVSFPKNGYWASYVRTGGKDAVIIVTLQKLAAE